MTLSVAADAGENEEVEEVHAAEREQHDAQLVAEQFNACPAALKSHQRS